MFIKTQSFVIAAKLPLTTVVLPCTILSEKVYVIQFWTSFHHTSLCSDVIVFSDQTGGCGISKGLGEGGLMWNVQINGFRAEFQQIFWAKGEELTISPTSMGVDP